MAEFWSNNDRGYRIRLWIDQVSQNIPGNSSQVRVRLALLNTTTTFADYNCSAWVDLNGQRLNWSGRPSVLSYNQTVWLIDQTITVGHNADGSKSFGVSANFSGDGGWSPGALSISGNSFTLTTIPRSSSVSIGSGTIGSSVTINIDRQSPSFKHTVRYVWGNKIGTIASNVDTSTSWTIPLNFSDDIPNATSGTGTLIIETYGDGKKIGEKSTTFTATVSDDVKPKLTGFTLTDGNTAAGNVVPGEQAFISVLSNIKVNFGQATGAYGSTITGYYAEIVGKNQSTNQNGGALGIMNYSGNVTIRARVIDSRGRTSNSIDKTVNILEYFSPILKFDVARSGAESSTLTITRNAKVAALTVNGIQKNLMRLTFKVAPAGTTTYRVDSGPASGSWTTVSDFVNSSANLQEKYVANKSWVIVGTLEDRFTRTEFSAIVGTETVVFSYDRNGVGVNKIRERGAFDVKGNVYIDGFLRSCTEWAGNVSVNDLLEGGAAWTNKDTPDSGWGILETFRISNLSTKEANQRFTSYGGHKVWCRHRDYRSGNWTPWVVEGIDNFYPVGSIYQSTSSANPATFMGGAWERFGNGKVLVGVDETDGDFNSSSKTGGSKKHSHSDGSYEAAIGPVGSDVASLGFKHGNQNVTGKEKPTYRVQGTAGNADATFNHFTDIVGTSGEASTLQPYIAVYRWRRIA